MHSADRTNLQYLLQRARALATELRAALEEVQEESDGNEEIGWSEAGGSEYSDYPSFLAELLEDWLDLVPAAMIGEGHVKVEISQ